VDLAAERGGNCELTKPSETIASHGVTILGPTNLPSDVPFHASQMFAKNLVAFLQHVIQDGQFSFDMSDQITRDTMITRGGEVVHPAVRKLLGLSEEAGIKLE
jgi:NAD(P) transhydrogenase subunit alpha